jgi:hypothetical protein
VFGGWHVLRQAIKHSYYTLAARCARQLLNLLMNELMQRWELGIERRASGDGSAITVSAELSNPGSF